MNLLTNPYEFSKPVYRSLEFFNRQEEINRIVRDLGKVRSIQLVGQYRIGKSSLLRYIQDNAANLLEEERVIPVYYDLSRRPSVRDGNDFFARLWRIISQALVEFGRNDASLPPEQDLDDAYEFDQYIDRWTHKEKFRFIILLDEFRLIAADQTFDLNFFDNLRSTLPSLTFIFTTPLSLSSFTHVQARSSPLWNMLDLVQLRLFQDYSDIYQLIHMPAEQSGFIWTPQEEEFIYRLGGQHPCYIQMAACALYDSRLGNDQRPNFKYAEQVFRENAVEHFRYLWTRALVDPERPDWTEGLRDSMVNLVQHGSSLDDTLARDLLDRSFIWYNSDTESWEPISIWFAEWLRQWSTEERKKIGKSLNAIHSSQLLSLPSESEILNEQYQIQKVVGKTKNSIVSRAWDINLKRTAAIKFLRTTSGIDEEAIQKSREIMKREASLLAEINHKNIGKVYTFLLDPPAIIMEWVEGMSLEEVLESGGNLTVIQVIHLGAQLLDALIEIHRMEIYHRDIKPSNIILTIDPKVIFKPILIDFGIARASNRDTISLNEDGSHGYVGTRPYSAPEQFLEPEGVGAPTDIFSLGLVLYELLTHEKPFPYNLPSQYSDGKLPNPPQLKIPQSLYRILCKMLNQYPDRRPSAEILKTELEQCLPLI